MLLCECLHVCLCCTNAKDRLFIHIYIYTSVFVYLDVGGAQIYGDTSLGDNFFVTKLSYWQLCLRCHLSKGSGWIWRRYIPASKSHPHHSRCKNTSKPPRSVSIQTRAAQPWFFICSLASYCRYLDGDCRFILAELVGTCEVGWLK